MDNHKHEISDHDKGVYQNTLITTRVHPSNVKLNETTE